MNERQKEILQIMYDAADYMTAEAIAEQVEYSVKTIRNDLKQLSVEIAENNIGVLEMKSGKGNRLVISPEEWKELTVRLEKAFQISTCAQQINERMCEILLKQKQITISRLEQIFYCSAQSVEKYLLQAEQWLANYNIKVLRKRGQGIWISSDEYTWRIALWGHFREILAEKFYTNKECSLLMEQYLDGFDTSGVRLAIQRIEEKFGIQFTYDDVQRLLFLVSVAVIKIRKGQTMTERLEEDWEGIAFDRILAENCCDTLQKCYRLKIPEEERRFICLCFGISEIQGFSDMFHKEACRQENSKIMMLAVKSMILVDHIFQSSLRNDIYLLDELFLYLKATICQRKHGIHRENPLLWQIKNKYPNIYAAAWSVSLLVDSEMHVGFGEHEVAYIALYLGGALERQSMEVKACILCNYGLGMAQILRSQIERLDSGLRITDVFSLREKSEIRKNNCDFVISTIPLENPFEGKEVVFVNSILKENDFSNIRKKMEEVSRKKHGVIAGREDSQEYQLHRRELWSRWKQRHIMRAY